MWNPQFINGNKTVNIGCFKAYWIVGKKLKARRNWWIFCLDSPSVSVFPYPFSSLFTPVSLYNGVRSTLWPLFYMLVWFSLLTKPFICIFIWHVVWQIPPSCLKYNLETFSFFSYLEYTQDILHTAWVFWLPHSRPFQWSRFYSHDTIYLEKSELVIL